jgi:hypothetical protein
VSIVILLVFVDLIVLFVNLIVLLVVIMFCATRSTPSGTSTIKPIVSVASICATATKAKTMIAKAAFQDLLACRIKNGGTCNYGNYTETINRYHELGNKRLTRHHLTYRMECCNLSSKTVTSVVTTSTVTITPHSTSDLSSLTDEHADKIADEIGDTVASIVHVNFGGHPKGSTCLAKSNYSNVIQKAITNAAIFFNKRRMMPKN